MSESTRASDRLDVEDDEAREARIGSLLQRLNGPSHISHSSAALEGPTFDFGDRTTFPVGPPTELLARVQAFLPELQASNEELAGRARADPSSVDIENIDPNQESYIQMNLGLGVFEDRSMGNTRRDEGEEDSDSSDSDGSESSSGSSDSAGSGDDSEDDSDEMEIITSAVLSRPIRPLPKRRAKPDIVVLSEHDASAESGSSAPA